MLIIVKIYFMKFLKTFFNTIKESVYSPIFYANLSNVSFKSAFGYFSFLALFLSLLQVLFILKPILMDTKPQIEKLINNVVSAYPKELQVKLQNGQISTNVTEPYYIFMDKTQNNVLAVIDTKTKFSVQQYNNYRALIWINKNAIYYQKGQGQLETIDLANAKNLIINKSSIQALIQKFTPYLVYVGPAIALIAFLGLLLNYVLRLAYLLILAGLIILGGRVIAKFFTFKEAYKIGLYSLTLGLLVEAFLNIIYPLTHLHGFPFMTTVITLIVVGVNFGKIKNTAIVEKTKE